MAVNRGRWFTQCRRGLANAAPPFHIGASPDLHSAVRVMLSMVTQWAWLERGEQVWWVCGSAVRVRLLFVDDVVHCGEILSTAIGARPRSLGAAAAHQGHVFWGIIAQNGETGNLRFAVARMAHQLEHVAWGPAGWNMTGSGQQSLYGSSLGRCFSVQSLQARL